MSTKKRSLALAVMLVVASLLVSACQMSLSTPPAATPTLIGTGLFVSPFPSVENPMEMIEQFAAGTATAAALTGTPGTPGTPGGTALTPVEITGTPSTPTNAAVSTTQAVVTSGATTAVIPTAGGPTPTQGPRPSSYTLQKGEWPYCIARRFNVNPEELLSVNGLTAEQSSALMPGRVLSIPQSGGPFPADRSWHDHPATYTVSSSDQTVYGVACYYGDIDPAAIAAANGISVSATLTSGQQLTIP
jgi:LysM repeat protein